MRCATLQKKKFWAQLNMLPKRYLRKRWFSAGPYKLFHGGWYVIKIIKDHTKYIHLEVGDKYWIYYAYAYVKCTIFANPCMKLRVIREQTNLVLPFPASVLNEPLLLRSEIHFVLQCSLRTHCRGNVSFWSGNVSNYIRK